MFVEYDKMVTAFEMVTNKKDAELDRFIEHASKDIPSISKVVGGTTLLHEAIKNKMHLTVKRLLKTRGIDVGIRDDEGEYAGHYIDKEDDVMWGIFKEHSDRIHGYVEYLQVIYSEHEDVRLYVDVRGGNYLSDINIPIKSSYSTRVDRSDNILGMFNRYWNEHREDVEFINMYLKFISEPDCALFSDIEGYNTYQYNPEYDTMCSHSILQILDVLSTYGDVYEKSFLDMNRDMILIQNVNSVRVLDLYDKHKILEGADVYRAAIWRNDLSILKTLENEYLDRDYVNDRDVDGRSTIHITMGMCAWGTEVFDYIALKRNINLNILNADTGLDVYATALKTKNAHIIDTIETISTSRADAFMSEYKKLQDMAIDFNKNMLKSTTPEYILNKMNGIL